MLAIRTEYIHLVSPFCFEGLVNEGGAPEAAYFWSHEYPSAHLEISSTRHEMVTSYSSRSPLPLLGKEEEREGNPNPLKFFSVVGRIRKATTVLYRKLKISPRDPSRALMFRFFFIKDFVLLKR